MAKYRKKPVVVEAMQYRAGNEADVCKFIGYDYPGDPGVAGLLGTSIKRFLHFDTDAERGKYIVINMQWQGSGAIDTESWAAFLVGSETQVEIWEDE